MYSISSSGSPFPGESLARFWDSSSASPSQIADQTLAEVVPIDPTNLDPSAPVKPRWPLGAINEGGWTYIRREGDVREELFHVQEDARESHNLVDSAAARAELERMRSRSPGSPPGR